MEARQKEEFLSNIFTASDRKAFFKRIEKLGRYYDELEKQEALERAENKGKEDMIKNLLFNGIDVDVISKSSGKSIEYILNIKKQLSI